MHHDEAARRRAFKEVLMVVEVWDVAAAMSTLLARAQARTSLGCYESPWYPCENCAANVGHADRD